MMKQTSSMMPILLVLLVLLVLIVLFRRSSLAKEREGAAYRHIGQQEANQMEDFARWFRKILWAMLLVWLVERGG